MTVTTTGVRKALRHNEARILGVKEGGRAVAIEIAKRMVDRTQAQMSTQIPVADGTSDNRGDGSSQSLVVTGRLQQSARPKVRRTKGEWRAWVRFAGSHGQQVHGIKSTTAVPTKGSGVSFRALKSGKFTRRIKNDKLARILSAGTAGTKRGANKPGGPIPSRPFDNLPRGFYAAEGRDVVRKELTGRQQALSASSIIRFARQLVTVAGEISEFTRNLTG